jgi:hypothetical protein
MLFTHPVWCFYCDQRICPAVQPSCQAATGIIPKDRSKGVNLQCLSVRTNKTAHNVAANSMLEKEINPK